MTLVLQKSGTEKDDSTSDKDAVKGISLSQNQMVMANVSTVKADFHEFSAETLAAGEVSWDEKRVFRVSARVAGRIERLYVGSTGTRVAEGQALFDVYSPDLVAAQKEYLLAIDGAEKLNDSPLSDSKPMMEALREASRNRLRFFGVTNAQIAELVRTRHLQPVVTVFSPSPGIVTEQLVNTGQYVNEGTPLFTVVPLSSVWVEAQVYENELAKVAVGTRASITAEAYPSKIFQGKVISIDSTVSPEARTVKVRVELSNSNGLLKPGMFVKVVIEGRAERELAVPESAAVIRGNQVFAWIQAYPGHFEPKAIAIGRKGDGFCEVLSGLAKGETVASSGGFLLDAEGRIQSSSSDAVAQPGGSKR
jgi:Cu(I)/Ag(I) efflux system membrane fusion protein